MDYYDYRVMLMREAGCEIGDHCRIYSEIATGEAYLVHVGNNVTISTEVTFLTHDNSPIKVIENVTDTVGEIRIGDNCFIGARSLIMPGVTLANNTIVAAGSVVSKSVTKEGTVIGGNPAKIIGDWDGFREKNEPFCFNFTGMNAEQKKNEILGKPERFLKRGTLN